LYFRVLLSLATSMFVDRVSIDVLAGKGGDGCLSFRREKYGPRGGPNGGDGGDGGSVILVAQEGVNSLANVAMKTRWLAEPGERGGSSNCHGRNGHDQILPVPIGTVVYDAEGGFVIKDLAAEGDRVYAARGGKGGKGNTRFKTSTNRGPRETTLGAEGEQRTIVLELQLLADVGLAGKPNAGKSTLLSRVSRARPEIADYPFTTKIPNLGIVQVDQDRSFVMADIPGLIEGAHLGAGLGHEFLRHVERTRVLVHMVEPAPVDGTDPIENYRTIRNELTQYQVDLTDRPEIIAVTKCELPEAREVQAKLAAETGREVLAFSSVTGLGIDKLKWAILHALDSLDAEVPVASQR
jgi:GTP-binding protein